MKPDTPEWRARARIREKVRWAIVTVRTERPDLQRAAHAARAEGKSLSAWIRDAMKAKLPRNLD